MKSKIKKRGFLVVLGIVLALLSISINNFSEDQGNNDESGKIKNETDLKVADSEITIVSPEDKTYTKPMDGYYPATYGFENDQNGQTPTDWVDNSETGATDVVESFGGHNKVIRLFDNNGYFTAWAINYFDARTSGTVEFWINSRKDDQDGIGVSLRNDGSKGPVIGIDDGGYYYTDDSGTYWLPFGKFNYTAFSWHHHKIVFNGNTQTYNWSIDDKLAALNLEFLDDISTVSAFHIYTGDNYDFVDPIGYFDAVSYSWDNDYEIGDNLYEGLLLSFELSINPNWIGYSLDGQDYKTILGNTTIPMPVDGPHTIQVFGNESGTIYKSDLRNFVVSIFDIITPENKVYTESMDGYYPASYGFENDQNGQTPTDWVYNSITGDANVVESFGGHNKVVRLFDNNGFYTSWMYNNFHAQTSGAVEFWINSRKDDQDGIGISLRNGASKGPVIGIDDGGYYYTDDSGTHWLPFGEFNYTAYSWYHHKIIFNGNTQRYDWYIDNKLAALNCEFLDVISSVNAFHIYTGDNYDFVDPIGYFDAVGYSWDDNYEIGDNLKEGLVLSFNCEIELDWIAYSLDGQEYKAILGNVTIPMPSDGTHTIQVFGDVYTSQIRPFKIGFTRFIILGDDDDNDDDDDEGEIEFLGPTLIIGGISLALGITGIAIYLSRKKKLVRE